MTKQARRLRPPFRRLFAVGAVAFVMASLVPAAASAQIAWDPGPDQRIRNRPATSGDEGAPSDGAFALGASPTLAVSNDGGTHYLQAVWSSDQPPGSEQAPLVARGPGCADAESPEGEMGYCMGAFSSRSDDGGESWSEPVRLSPLDTHAERVAVAAAGQYVYAVYVTQVGYERAMCTSSARVLFLRVNDNYGDPGSWGEPIQLSGSANRVDDPSISAFGDSVYVIFTGTPAGAPPGFAQSGVMTQISTDHGDSFTQQRIGYTTSTYDNTLSPGGAACPEVTWSPASLEGSDAAPVIAGNGTHVGAAWFGNDDGKLVAKISLDNGASWPGDDEGEPCPAPGTGQCTIHLSAAAGKGPIGDHETCPSYPSNPGACGLARPAAAAGWGSGGRIAFGWIEGGAFRTKGAYFRLWTGAGSWQPVRFVSCLTSVAPCAAAPAGQIYDHGLAPSVALFGTSGAAMAWMACPKEPDDACGGVRSADSAKRDPGAEILYKETGDNGVNFTADLTVGGSYKEVVSNGPSACEESEDPCAALSEWPSLVFDAPSEPTFAGCGQSPTGPLGLPTPTSDCVRYLSYLGRNHEYTSYRIYMHTGDQP